MGPFDPVAIFEALNRHGVRFVVIGALAAVLQGWTQATEDADITPDRDVQNLVRLVAALDELEAVALGPDGEPNPALCITDQTLRIAERTLVSTKHGELDIVINPAAANGYPDLIQDSTLLPVGRGVTVPVLSLRRVIESKEAVGRPKDLAIVPALKELDAARHRTQP